MKEIINLEGILTGRKAIPIGGGIQNGRQSFQGAYQLSHYIAFDTEYEDFKKALENFFDNLDEKEGKLLGSDNMSKYNEWEIECYFKDIDVYRSFLNEALKGFSLLEKDDWKLRNGEPANLPKEYLLSEAKKTISNLGLNR